MTYFIQSMSRSLLCRFLKCHDMVYYARSYTPNIFKCSLFGTWEWADNEDIPMKDRTKIIRKTFKERMNVAFKNKIDQKKEFKRLTRSVGFCSIVKDRGTLKSVLDSLRIKTGHDTTYFDFYFRIPLGTVVFKVNDIYLETTYSDDRQLAFYMSDEFHNNYGMFPLENLPKIKNIMKYLAIVSEEDRREFTIN